jgi:putative pyruvate formate lyase activating enzyme
MHQVTRYTDLCASGALDERIRALEAVAANCALCPRACGVNRLNGEKGFCQAGAEAVVSKALPHFGEEPVLTGAGGSGTIFFAHCSLSCLFCQNYQISQERLGTPADDVALADTMLSLQAQGCHNINLVSATHFLPMVIRALKKAAAGGLSLPLVYNSNGYESPEVMRLLDGIIDIYLPDAKYGDDETARELSGAQQYTHFNRAALKEMHRQVGPLETSEEGIALRGLIIRHLVLPDGLARTGAVLQMIRDELGTDVHLSLMGQYFPAYRAHTRDTINRKLTPEEYRLTVNLLEQYGFEQGWCQYPEEVEDCFVPDFTKKESWH